MNLIPIHNFNPSFILNGVLELVVVLSACIFFYLQIKKSNILNSISHPWISLLSNKIKVPSVLFVTFVLIHYLNNVFYFSFPNADTFYGKSIYNPLDYLIKLMEFLALLWVFWRILFASQLYIQERLKVTRNIVIKIFLPIISNLARISVIMIILNMVSSALDLSPLQATYYDNITRIILIVMLTWVFSQIVNGLEQVIVQQYVVKNASELAKRKVKTQVLILKRIILALGFIFFISSILLVFESVRRLGAGLLTTAGIISAVGAFASQQSLSRLFAGLQIAFTQPIRIGDTVIVDNEYGEIEEITLSYIVVKIWDLRRLILPTDYITTKGFQNLTRTSTQLLGTIFLYVDYTLPIHIIRNYFKKIVQQSVFWDQNVAALHVTDMKESTMELRVLVSASDGAKLWELRCEMREKLIAYIATHYKEQLPIKRTKALV